MQFKVPKNTEKYEWTKHAVFKMKQYGLSPQRILRAVKNPLRTEEGIVKNTIAVMQPASMRTKDGKRTWSQEIWTMYQIKRKAKRENLKTFKLQGVRFISAWRYPGVSPKRNPIPEEILRELET
jgi:hypothetical protein